MNKMNLICCIYCLLILCTSISVNGQNINKNDNIELKEFILLKWNEVNALSYKNDLSGNCSFKSFEWLKTDSSFAFLSDIKNEVIILNAKDNSIENKIKLDFRPIQFTYADNDFFFLTTYAVVIYNKTGRFKNAIPLQSQNNFKDIAVVNSNIYLIKPNGQSISISDNKTYNGWPLLDNSFAESILLDEHSYAINCYDRNSRFLNKKIVQTNQKLGCAVLQGGDEKYLYLEVQYILNENPIEVKRQLEVFERSSFEISKTNTIKPINIIDLPDYSYTYTSDPFLITNDGILSSVTSQLGVYIFHLPLKKIGQHNILYPKKLTDSKLHYTDYSLISKKNNK